MRPAPSRPNPFASAFAEFVEVHERQPSTVELDLRCRCIELLIQAEARLAGRRTLTLIHGTSDEQPAAAAGPADPRASVERCRRPCALLTTDREAGQHG